MSTDIVVALFSARLLTTIRGGSRLWFSMYFRILATCSWLSTSSRTAKYRRAWIHSVASSELKGGLISYFKGGGVTPLCAPTPLCQNRICLTRGVSPGAYRGAQGRSLKNTWKMFVFNCMIHFVTCTRKYLPNHGVIGESVASLDAESRPKSET